MNATHTLAVVAGLLTVGALCSISVNGYPRVTAAAPLPAPIERVALEDSGIAAEDGTEAADDALLESAPARLLSTLMPKERVEEPASSIVEVPFYSQFADISDPEWKKVGCGIASLAMVMDYYGKKTVSVDALLTQGIKAGAYSDAGWTYAGLIGVSRTYGMDGESFDYARLGTDGAFEKFAAELENGPVIASVHYTFEPMNPIPHLVVINSMEGDYLYYNDPAEPGGGGKISIEKFKRAWKERYIVIRPA